VHCDLSNVLSSVKALEQCVIVIGHWMSANRQKLDAEKTELMWAGTKYTVASFLCLHDLTLMLIGLNTVIAANAVHVLCVFFTLDLALEKHITTVSAKCFFQLRQLYRMQRSLDRESAATLVHAFVTRDYGNTLLTNVPRTVTDKLQQVLNDTARVITGTWKFCWRLTP